jgi:hypothetical protein
MSIGRWSELSAGHKVRYTGEVIFLVITMSKTSGVAKRWYGLVLGVSVPKIPSEYSCGSFAYLVLVCGINYSTFIHVSALFTALLFVSPQSEWALLVNVGCFSRATIRAL